MRGRQDGGRGSGSLIDALSDRNPRVKRLRRLLGRRSFRAQESSIVIEGPVLAREAIDAGLELGDLFVEIDSLDQWSDVIRDAVDRGAELCPVRPGSLDDVGGAVTSQGLALVASWQPRLLRDVTTVCAHKDPSWLLVLESIGDPGNAGTLLRSAEAAGACAVIFVGESVDAGSPKVVRAAAGSLFRMPVIVGADVTATVEVIRSAGFESIGAVATGGEPHDTMDLSGSIAVVLGSEAHGLSDAALAAVDRRATIEMAGPTESLNAAMAGTVLAFEVLRQRRRT